MNSYATKMPKICFNPNPVPGLADNQVNVRDVR